MSFTSPAFGVFVVLALVVWYGLPTRAWTTRKAVLTLASWFFVTWDEARAVTTSRTGRRAREPLAGRDDSV